MRHGPARPACGVNPFFTISFNHTGRHGSVAVMTRLASLLDEDIPRAAQRIRELPRICVEFEGRIPRSTFWLGTACVAMLAFLIESWMFRLAPVYAPALGMAVNSLALYPFSALATQRGRDRGRGDLWGVSLVLACVISGILVQSLGLTPYGATASAAHICLMIYALFDLGLMPGEAPPPAIDIAEKIGDRLAR